MLVHLDLTRYLILVNLILERDEARNAAFQVSKCFNFPFSWGVGYPYIRKHQNETIAQNSQRMSFSVPWDIPAAKNNLNSKSENFTAPPFQRVPLEKGMLYRSYLL